tara:strand:- start:26539 stop:27258 length:720 start_codon:yes stop_codon:yes gene_type:complete
MKDFYKLLGDNFSKSKLNLEKKIENFPRFVNRRDVATFLNRYEIFKKIVGTHGSIIECGVNLGGGLFSWLHFSSILEPYNSSRYIVGFDTFDGFQSDNENDDKGKYRDKKLFKDFISNQSYDEIKDSIEIQNQNRPLNQLSKLSVVKGDATETIPKFLDENPHFLVSLLHIDFDIHAPTKVAIENFLPRMPKGSIIAFDDLNAHEGPGETVAYLESMDIKKYRLCRNSFDSYLCYLIIE